MSLPLRAGEYAVRCETYLVHRRCNCGDGEFISIGEGRGNAYGTLWSHKCSSCGKEESFTVQYPEVRHSEIGG